MHKGCGMERQRRLGRRRHRRDKSRKSAKKTASETSAVCSLCLNKGCKINLNNVCSYKEINKARNTGRPILNQGCEFPKRIKPPLQIPRSDPLAEGCSGGFLTSEARAASAPQTAHTTTPNAKHYGRKKRSRETLLRSRFYNT